MIVFELINQNGEPTGQYQPIEREWLDYSQTHEYVHDVALEYRDSNGEDYRNLRVADMIGYDLK